MIKELVVGIAAATIIGCGGVDEVVEREILSVRPFSIQNFSYFAIAYDVDRDGVVDYFDVHLISGSNVFGWFYLSPVIDTRYDTDQIDGLGLN